MPIVLLESFLPRSSRSNVLLYAALDGWRRHMAEHGHESLSAALDLPQHLRAVGQRFPTPTERTPPGERLNDVVVDYLRSGRAVGMNIPDPADPSLDTFRVVAC